eukprot:jgi/Tetstr1/437577/TSEL_026249.t1
MFLAQTHAESIWQRDYIELHLSRFGLLRNPNKGVWEPAQKLVHLRQFNPRRFASLGAKLGACTIDRFATAENALLPHYNARWRDPRLWRPRNDEADRYLIEANKTASRDEYRHLLCYGVYRAMAAKTALATLRALDTPTQDRVDAPDLLDAAHRTLEAVGDADEAMLTYLLRRFNAKKALTHEEQLAERLILLLVYNNDAGSGDNHGPQVNIGKVEGNAELQALAAHAYKANTRSAIADDTVRMGWLRPINQTVVFRVTGGGEAQYAMLDGKVLEESSLEEKLGAWTTLLTPPPSDIAPEDMGLHARYQRLRKYGDCLRLCRVDAMWHGGYSFCVIQLGSKVECKVHPGKVSDATMKEWLE